MEPANITNHISHFTGSIKDLFTSIGSFFLFLIGMVISYYNLYLILLFFIGFLFADYLTGILASWIERNKSEEKTPIKVYFVETKRLRASGIKVIGYMLIIVLSGLITLVVFQDRISLFGVTTPLSILEIATAGCATIEFLSNVENIKRCGFDLFGSITNGIKKVWNLINLIKTGKDE